MQDRIREQGEKAGIKNVRCSPHTFRHTFAKLCVMNGANAFQLQAIWAILHWKLRKSM